jgi:hypothetical protein
MSAASITPGLSDRRTRANLGVVKRCVNDLVLFFTDVGETLAEAEDMAMEAIAAYAPTSLGDYVDVTRAMLLILTANGMLRDATAPGLAPAIRLRTCDKAAKLNREANQILALRRKYPHATADQDERPSLADHLAAVRDATPPTPAKQPPEPPSAPTPAAAKPPIQPTLKPQAQNAPAPQAQNTQSPQAQNALKPQAQNTQQPQAQNTQSPQAQTIRAPQPACHPAATKPAMANATPRPAHPSHAAEPITPQAAILRTMHPAAASSAASATP